MTVTIKLTDAQVKGIKDYLKEVADIEKPNKEDVQSEVREIVNGYLQAKNSSLTDYIDKYERNEH